MGNKSIVNGTSRQLLIACLIAPAVALAQQCVLQTKTVTQGQIQVEERSQVSAQVVPVPGGDQRCMVSMRGRVGSTWYTGFGEFVFARTSSPEQACSSARSRAEASITSQAGARQVATDSTLVCREDPMLDALRKTDIGTVAKLAQYRPHPVHGQPHRWPPGTPVDASGISPSRARALVGTCRRAVCPPHTRERSDVR